jgi:hypothetical protein
MEIKTSKDFVDALKYGPYVWPGGYPIFFVTSDGGALSFATAWKERAVIVQAIVDNDTRGGWHVFGSDVNWEDPELYDDHTGNRIESAYAEDDAKGKTDKIPKRYDEWRKSFFGRYEVFRRKRR